VFGDIRSKPSQSSVPAGLTLASDFGLCFQCQVGWSLVLRRPFEITRLTRHYRPDHVFAVECRSAWITDEVIRAAGGLVVASWARCADVPLTDSGERSQGNTERRMQCRFKITTLRTMTT
jgi:hypothetical protein